MTGDGAGAPGGAGAGEDADDSGGIDLAAAMAAARAALAAAEARAAMSAALAAVQAGATSDPGGASAPGALAGEGAGVPAPRGALDASEGSSEGASEGEVTGGGALADDAAEGGADEGPGAGRADAVEGDADADTADAADAEEPGAEATSVGDESAEAGDGAAGMPAPREAAESARGEGERKGVDPTRRPSPPAGGRPVAGAGPSGPPGARGASGSGRAPAAGPRGPAGGRPAQGPGRAAPAPGPRRPEPARPDGGARPAGGGAGPTPSSGPGARPQAKGPPPSGPSPKPQPRGPSGPVGRPAPGRSGGPSAERPGGGRPPSDRRPAVGGAGKPAAARPAPGKPAAARPAPGKPSPRAGDESPGQVMRRFVDAAQLGRPVGKDPAGKGAAGKAPATGAPGGTGARPAAPGGKTPADKLAGLGGARRLRRFADLGWRCTPGEGAAGVLAFDLGVEGLCVTTFDGDLNRARDQAHPTAVIVRDPHAFRSLEKFSLDSGLAAYERWPSERVLRGIHGSLLLPSQIGLVEFPADHVLAGMLGKLTHEHKKEPRDVVLTLPTFLPSDRDDRLRAAVAPWKKGAFKGVPSAIAAAYFHLAPALDAVPAAGDAAELVGWSREALERGRVLVLDWGASGLHYGLVTVKRGSPTELRLVAAGTWPSLGGHRLTLSILRDLKRQLAERVLAAGPSDALLSRALIAHGEALGGRIPMPPGYEEAFRRLERLGPGPLPDHEADERRRLRNVLLPTAWRFAPGEEPPGYAPYRKLAIEHFKALWREAERLKRLLLSDPDKHRARKAITWNVGQLDSPFLSHLDERQLPYPVEQFLGRVERGLAGCLGHVDRRLAGRGVDRPVHVAVAGMQACTSLLGAALARRAGSRDARALAKARQCPQSSDPLELKSVVNRGAALLARDKRSLDFGAIPDVLPFSIQIADCLGNVAIFTAGPIDELTVFQRRFRVEDGMPQLEFYIYESEDRSQRGTWGAIDFHRPFDFSERDRTFAVDPRYGFGGELPRLSDLKGDDGAGLAQVCFERGPAGRPRSGSLSLREYAPRDSDEARRLLHFLEHGLTGEFYRKVYLIEREFRPPPRRFDFVYQRYYLSRSQVLLVVREWWAPAEGNKLMRHKTLHTCQGTTTANTILGVEWGRT